MANPVTKPGITITRLELLYKSGSEFDVDLTYLDPSGSVQSVLLPPEISIEGIPRTLTSGHASEFELMPSQESTFTWSAQVEHRFTTVLRLILAEVISGKRTIALLTHFKDHLGKWHTARVIGRFQVGKFLIIEAPPAEPSPAPNLP